MSEEEFNGVQKASIILIVSLSLCLSFNFIPESWEWTFPYYDSLTKSFSWNPAEPKTYLLKDIWPYFMAFIKPVFYISAFKCVGDKMIMPKLGNIWNYYILIDVLLTLDFMISFHQTPFRLPLIVAFMFIQGAYLFYADSQRNDT